MQDPHGTDLRPRPALVALWSLCALNLVPRRSGVCGTEPRKNSFELLQGGGKCGLAVDLPVSRDSCDATSPDCHFVAAACRVDGCQCCTEVCAGNPKPGRLDSSHGLLKPSQGITRFLKALLLFASLDAVRLVVPGVAARRVTGAFNPAWRFRVLIMQGGSLVKSFCLRSLQREQTCAPSTRRRERNLHLMLHR